MGKDGNLLEKSHDFMDGLFDQLPLPSLVIGPTGILELINRQFEILSGFLRPEVEEHLKWSELAHPDDRDSFMELFLSLSAGKESVATRFRTRIKTKSGFKNVYVRVQTLMTKQNQSKILVQLQELNEDGLLRDYELPDTDYRWRSLLIEGMDSVAVLDLNGNILFVSKTLSGASVDRYLGKNVYSVLNSSEGAKFRSLLRQVIDTQSPISWQLWSDFSGVKRHYFMRVSPVTRLGEIYSIIVLISDTTELKESDADQLKRIELQKHRQKLEALGTLAAGVAHEINNPLTGILNYAEIVRDQIGTNEHLRKNLDIIIRESERISVIVRNLLGFVHKEERIRIECKTGEILFSSVQLLLPFMIKDGISIEGLQELGLDSEIPGVEAEPNKLKQVFLNLLTNSRDSLNDKYPDSHPNKKIRIYQSVVKRGEARYVKVSVEDTGAGIKKENRSKIFDPFFTTKATSSGIGLGLSISYDIIRDFAGEIDFETTEGEFARFDIILPVPEKNS
ncbi:PAS domain-containing sensor histidine kinase [Leptospira fluminis]|uniref:histidine kinase n=1 Tax=Leptospira fluminis TaxID=2484979 RepID=A0A4R9GR03_9LEPT|nr:PAS domain-containing sensor histidine kinase [Leptospira fluminis]TGK19262.1 PAS domain-containing sensor histidine kinase [Leptospira fluminis]